jgi:serine/threonine-protein kinase
MPPTNVKKIGKYPVLEVIGRGGMGMVFKATDPSLHRPVAIKMISCAFAETTDLLKRFHHEAQFTGKLNHPNIVTVYDMGEHEGNPYIVMEFLEGESLQELIDQRRALLLSQKLDYLIQTCRGLEYSHARQVIHRDIKPANIVVLNDGTIKIVDFGIARMGEVKITRPGQMIGTPEYMSPEQIMDGVVDHRTDIWAVGVLMFQLFTYELPFHGQEPVATLRKITDDPVPRLSKYLATYPEELDTILARALAKDKEKRYRSMEEFAFDLAQVERNLRRQSVQAMLQMSLEFMGQGQWTRAREQLVEVLKLDPQHIEANRCMHEVQEQLQQQRRKQQVSELRAQAEHLVEEGQLAVALRLLEDASSLDDSPELAQFREKVKELWERAEQIQSAWQRSHEARGAGDLDRAMLALGEVLRLNPDHQEALAMQATLANGIAARARSRELRQLVDSARKEISDRKFTEALNLLKRVEELDANSPVLRQLTRMASEGQEQEHRRQELQAATARIEDALNAADFATASACLQDALERFPAEASLLHLKALTERQRERHERRAWVEDCIHSARKFLNDGNPEEALVKLEDAAQRYPTEPLVQSMLAIAQQSVAQQRTEKRKAEVVSLARNAISRKAFEEAVGLLEAARAELNTPDFDDLIAFAHNKSEALNRQQRIAAVANRSQALVQNQQHAQAIELLEKALQEMPDEELRFLLEEAKVLQQEQQRIEREIIARANQMVEQDRPEEAVALLQEEKALLTNSSAFAETLERAERKRQWFKDLIAQQQAVKDALGRGDFDTAETALKECRARFGEHAEWAALQEQLERGLCKAHTSTVENAMSEAALLAKVGSLDEGLQALQRVSRSVQYLSPDDSRKYERCTEQLRVAIELRCQQAEEQTRAELQKSHFDDHDAGLESAQGSAEPAWEKAKREQFSVPEPASHGAARANAKQPQNAVQQLTPPPSGISRAGQNDTTIESQEQLREHVYEFKTTSDLPSEVDPEPTLPVLNHNLSPLPEASSSRSPGPTIASSNEGSIQFWSADILSQIEKQLALYIGPLARVIVRRAALKTTDWDGLFSLIVESVDTDAERQALLTFKQRLNLGSAGSGRPAPIGATVFKAELTQHLHGNLTPAIIAQATRLLARYVGPISSVLVRKATQRADDVRALYLLLADELEGPAERAQFLREAGISDQ